MSLDQTFPVEIIESITLAEIIGGGEDGRKGCIFMSLDHLRDKVLTPLINKTSHANK